MKNLKDAKTTIYPSTTRGGKELPSSSALDSPSVLSKLATPKPATAMNSDMLHVIVMPLLLCMILMMKLPLCLILLCDLVLFLMNNLLGLEKLKILNLMILMKVMMKNHLLFLRVMYLIKMLL